MAALSSTEAPKIRLAVAEDLNAILGVEISAAEAFLATEYADVPDGPATDLDAYRRRIGAGLVWVAEVKGAIVGSLVAEVAPDALHLWELAVRLSHQRRGVGRILVLTALAAACAKGLPAVTLTTFRGVSFNAPIYHSLGFESLALPPQLLAAILEAEAAWGLRDRCAMRFSFDGSNLG